MTLNFLKKVSLKQLISPALYGLAFGVLGVGLVLYHPSHFAGKALGAYSFADGFAVFLGGIPTWVLGTWGYLAGGRINWSDPDLNKQVMARQAIFVESPMAAVTAALPLAVALGVTVLL